MEQLAAEMEAFVVIRSCWKKVVSCFGSTIYGVAVGSAVGVNKAGLRQCCLSRASVE